MGATSDTTGGLARERLAAQVPGAFRAYLERQLFAQRANYHLDPTKMSGEERAQWIVKNSHACIKELMEMHDYVDGWKYWQTKFEFGPGEFKDRAEFVEDGVDALKFLANMLLAAGVTDDELSEVWERKTVVNAQRQEDGYAGVGAEHSRRDPDRGLPWWEKFWNPGEEGERR